MTRTWWLETSHCRKYARKLYKFKESSLVKFMNLQCCSNKIYVAEQRDLPCEGVPSEGWFLSREVMSRRGEGSPRKGGIRLPGELAVHDIVRDGDMLTAGDCLNKTLGKRRYNTDPPFSPLAQLCVAVVLNQYPSKHGKMSQCCVNVGSAS